MERRSGLAVVASTLVATVLATFAPSAVATAQDGPVAADPGPLRAGVATADVSWHLGASGGQFAETGTPISPDFVDPFVHATRKQPADALYSRILTRALVVEDGDGDRVAIVGNDLYLPNDILNRRVADLLEDHDAAVAAGTVDGPLVGVGNGTLAVTVSHNHNSAFYSSPAWGTWIFQDVVDLRFFDHVAQGMAQAVIDAVADMRPVRMAGATVPFNEIQSHTYGPKIADDGTPAGQPYWHDAGLMHVVRFDDVSDPGNPQPYANWVTLGIHPEWTWGYDVFNGDITHTAMRVIDRELGTTTVMSQRDTGSSGPHKDTRAHDPEDRREFQDNGFENLDVAARLWADRVVDAYRAMDTNAPTAPYDPAFPRRDAQPVQLVPFTNDADVDSVSVRVAPPAERPVPGISNCKTSSLFHGDVQLPLLGLPDCNDDLAEVGEPIVDATPFDERDIYDQLRAAGIPIPDSYFFPSLTAVEETAAVHLMAFRIGDIGITFCPCEQFADTSHNISTRLDTVDGNVWRGWDWTSQPTPAGRDWCVDNGDGTWTCANPQNPTEDLAPVPDHDYRLMVAQVNNDAAGWEDDLASLFGASEPTDPDEVFGNFTHAEATDHGYAMVVPVGMANDYFGYVPNYREMRAHEHYRKALNALGNHGADFLATRLVTIAASLNGGPDYAATPLDLVYQAEDARMTVLARGFGELAEADRAVWEAAAYVDGGAPEVTEQPADITRYAAAHLRWVGGSNWTDMPHVRVERRVGDAWEAYATGDGEVPIMLDFPTPVDLPAVIAGQFVWRWTASFEAFGSQVPLPDATGVERTTTPAGTYRFVVTGNHRSAPLTTDAYELVSEPFTVSAWDGVTIESHELTPDGDLVVTVGPRTTIVDDETGAVHVIGPVDYPDGYESPFAILNGGRQLFRYGSDDADVQQWYCGFCRFRPWADSGDVASLTVTVTRADGTVAEVAARPSGDTFVADLDLRPGDVAAVLPGGVVTEHGDVNAAGLEVSGAPTPTPDPGPADEPADSSLPATGGGFAAAALALIASARMTRRRQTGA